MIKQTKLIMGMPITVRIEDERADVITLAEIWQYFYGVDHKFSTFKKGSEISKINRGELDWRNMSREVIEVLILCEDTKGESHGYFNIKRRGIIDPSGLVKGWAVYNASKRLMRKGCKNFFIDAGGDIQVSGKNGKGENWTIGIKNPFAQKEIVKVVTLRDEGIATSGTYIRGKHIYNPKTMKAEDDFVSLTVIGPNVYEADRFATAAFAMGKKGLGFIGTLKGFEGYMIDKSGRATYTSGFSQYTC